METITLFLDRTGWHAHHTEARVRKLFGTDTLPCGFGASSPPEKVLASIQARNPGCIVRLGAYPRSVSVE